jgi:lambda family phage portal protein
MKWPAIFGRQQAAVPAVVERTEPTMGRPAMPRRMRSLSTMGAGLFAAADSNRLTASWPSTPMTADQIVMRNQRVLVARSREQAANNDYGKAFLRMYVQNVVGPNGPLLNMQLTKANGSMDSEVNDGVEAAWRDWGKAENCDVTAKRTWRRLVKSMARTKAKDGEYFLRLVYGADAGPWGFAVQTIDPQRCPVDLNEPPRTDGSFIRHGIRFNRYGRPLAYGFTVMDEGKAETQFYGPIPVQWVPAEEIIHGFTEDMEGQKRGLPHMATGLFRMRHLNGFEDAVIVNARVGASKMGFVQWKDGFGPELEEDEEVPEITAEPGVFETLPEGAELAEWNPQFPSGDTGPFVKHLLRGISAGFGTPYNEFANDLEGVNFSSIRQGTLDSREHWKDEQEDLIEDVARVFSAWLTYSLLAGRIKGASGRPLNTLKVDKYAAAANWQGRRWDWIDPNADTKSAVDRKNNFLKAPSDIVREQGADPSAVWVQTARDLRAQVEALVVEGFPKDKAEELVLQAMRVQPPPKPEPKAKDGTEAAAA